MAEPSSASGLVMIYKQRSWPDYLSLAIHLGERWYRSNDYGLTDPASSWKRLGEEHIIQRIHTRIQGYIPRGISDFAESTLIARYRPLSQRRILKWPLCIGRLIICSLSGILCFPSQLVWSFHKLTTIQAPAPAPPDVIFFSGISRMELRISRYVVFLIVDSILWKFCIISRP